MEATFFTTQAQFRKWLVKNHKKKTELIVGYYKISSGKPSITWSQSVDQALCFGWIDSVRRTIDSERYCIRFTPRKSNSIWSNINIQKMNALDKLGLVTAEGKKAFALRTNSKSRIYWHEKEIEKLSSNYEKKFKKNKIAWAFFSQQPPSYKRVIIHWVMVAKQEKTQVTRLEKLIHFSEQQKRVL